MMAESKKVLPCWIITLHPDGDGVQRLLENLSAQGIEAELFPGVDGRHAMPALDADEFLDVQKSRLRHLCDMTNSEVGCYLSHLRAIKKAYALGCEKLCLLEDDVEVEPEFGRALREINTFTEDFEFVRLMALRVRKRKIVRDMLQGSHRLTRPERGVLGAQGYVVNRNAMAKIIQHASNIFEPIDKVYDHYWEFGLHQYCVEPHLLWERPHPSSILKSNVKRARVGFFYYLMRPFVKGLLSKKRNDYLTAYSGALYPAELPSEKPGKTARMKMPKVK
ncbi:hypothetical protein R50072_38890 [Simiduia litorea]|uniref:glycosyltransferase family 25 protein n=1 Tax=Simiduia litorea TaxID=1435348 RepID=UPI0036F1FAE9